MRAVQKHTACRWVMLYVKHWLKSDVQQPSGKLKGWLFCYRGTSKKTVKSIKEKIKNAIGIDDMYSLWTKLDIANLILRGWCESHRYSNAHKHFKAVDAYIYTKLVSFIRTKHCWRGSGYRKAPRSFFEKLGLYHLHGKTKRWPGKVTKPISRVP